jgi:hypothetical protein
MRIFKKGKENEEFGGIRRFVEEYLVPGIRHMLRQELNRIDSMDNRICDLELNMKNVNITVNRLDANEHEKIGYELINDIMNRGTK